MTYKLNSEKVLFTQLGEEGVLYDVENNAYISLNETFFKILRYVEEGQSVSSIVHSLCNEYSVSEQECTAEVESTIRQMRERNFLLETP